MKPERKEKYDIGVMQGRLLPPVDGMIQRFPRDRWTEEFGIAAALGLSYIEFIFEEVPQQIHPLLLKEGVDRIRELSDSTGVQIRTVCADYFMEYPLHHPEHQEHAQNMLKTLIRQCALLDVERIVIPCVDQSTLRNEVDMNNFVHALNECLPAAAEHEVVLTLETDLPPQPFSALLMNINSPQVQVNYDTGNSAALGYDCKEEFDAYGPYITHVHIKDRKRSGGTVPLGTGDADFDAFFTCLEVANFSGPIIIQAARQEENMELETVAEYLRFVQTKWRKSDA